MKIVAGLGSVDDYIALVEAGADEVFCGYVPYSWNERYGNLMPLNRREVLYYHVQIGSFSEMEILSRMMAVKGVPVTITFNALYYIQDQYQEIAKMIRQLMAIGFERYIIADIGLLAFLREQGIQCKVHISGEMGEVNRLTFSVLQPYGISRMIYHRQNTLKDMMSCIHNNKLVGQLADIEYEAFLLNERCQFHGGFCNSVHCDELQHMCKIPYQLVPIADGDGVAMKADTKENDLVDTVGMTGCGLCALPKLKKAGITHLKIVGRGNFAECMAKDISLVKQALGLLELDEKNYKQQILELLGGACSGDCYYRDL